MSRTRMVLLRIAGSVVGLLAGGVLLYLGACAVVAGTIDTDNDAAFIAFVIYGSTGFLVGVIIGAAAGATVTQKVLKQRTSFWRALLGALVGSVVPFIGTVVGAVVGSGGKDKKSDAASSGNWPHGQ